MKQAINKKLKNNCKILLITTKGCEGCRIMRNIITKVIADSKYDIEFIIKDVSEIDKTFFKNNNITDFPTTIFMISDEIKAIFVGTQSYVKLSGHINILFHCD